MENKLENIAGAIAHTKKQIEHLEEILYGFNDAFIAAAIEAGEYKVAAGDKSVEVIQPSGITADKALFQYLRDIGYEDIIEQKVTEKLNEQAFIGLVRSGSIDKEEVEGFFKPRAPYVRVSKIKENDHAV